MQNGELRKEKTAHFLNSPFLLLNSVADRVGFEPTRLFRPTRVPVVLLKPLGHLSYWIKNFEWRIKKSILLFLNSSFKILNFQTGQGGIRTPDTLAGITVFETAAFDHSATCPIFANRELWNKNEENCFHNSSFKILNSRKRPANFTRNLATWRELTNWLYV